MDGSISQKWRCDFFGSSDISDGIIGVNKNNGGKEKIKN